MGVIGGSGPPLKPGPSLRKKLILDTFRGTPRARIWPTSRPTTPGSRRAYTAQLFAAANRICKVMWGPWMANAWQATKGTPLLPRDLIIAAMYGRLFWITLDDGTRFYSMATRIDVSASLDVLGSTVGKFLQRGAKYWEIVELPAQAIRWFYSGAYGTRPSAGVPSLYASKGFKFTANAAITIAKIASLFTPVAGANYRIGIYSIDGSNKITAILATTNSGFSDVVHQFHEFTLAYTFAAGTAYVILLSRTDSTDTYALPTGSAANNEFQLSTTITNYARLAKKSPAINDTVELGATTSTFAIFGFGM